MTHRLINQVAAGVGTIGEVALDQLLKGSVGFVRGLDTPLKNEEGKINTVLEWLALGGTAEDEPSCRPARHFHDPLQPWESAGLTTANPFIIWACDPTSLFSAGFPSSVLWGQKRDQNIGEQRSWFEARSAYFNALTGASQADRDRAWASTFQTLGQLMHLVADASVPEHVRNDSHLLETAVRKVLPAGYGSYEWWVEDNSEFVPLSGARHFDPAIFQQATNNGLAPNPIARLTDTDTYTGAGSGAGVTLGPAIGIAEFANANFFSEDTGNRSLLGRNYPFPALDLLAGSQLQAPQGTNLRRYYKKGPDGGLPVDPVLVECVFDNAARAAGLPVPFTYNCVDENVWQATAQEMVPRAVEYAAGILEYFFRGQIEIAPPERFLYGRTNYREPFQVTDPENNVNVFTQLRFKIRNATPNEETWCPAGQQCAAPRLFAVVQYRTGGGADLIKAPETPLSDDLVFAVSQPLALTPTRDFQEVTFDFTSPMPANVADVFLTVVYRGPLGLEPDAVMVGGKDLFEPTPVLLANGTDYFCFDGELKHVADFNAFPPFDFSLPPPQRRDPTEDGTPDLLGPEDEFSVLVKAAAVATIPSGSNVDQQLLEQRTYGQYTRFVVLQDQPTFVLSELAGSLVDWGITPPKVDSNVLVVPTPYPANYNRLVAGTSGRLDHQYASSGTYRGVVTTQFAVFIHQPVGDFRPCFAESATKEPIIPIDSAVIGS